MSDRRSFGQLIEEVDFLLALRRHIQARGIHLIVTHLDHLPGTICAPGEIIGDISLGGSPSPTSLGLSQMSLLLMDCLWRYRMPLSALRIEQIMNSDPFYVNYAVNQIGHDQIIAKPDSRNVRVCAPRIQKRMGAVFHQLGLRVDPLQILTSEPTDSNAIVYRLKATVEIVHIDKHLSLLRHSDKAVLHR
jgi:hypothetical protein